MSVWIRSSWPGIRSSWLGIRSGRLLIAAALLLPAAALGACSNRPAGEQSVILIVIDTLRADALGCYGSDRGLTPNLDAFVEDGVIFRAAYSQSPWTLPSFASLFTSTYPGAHGAVGTFDTNFHAIRKRFKTAAQAFRAKGYRTGAIVNNIFLGREFGFKKGFETFDFYPAEIHKIRKAAEVTDLAIRWLDRHAGEEEPYFLFLHYYDPHFAYLPPPDLVQKFGGTYTQSIKKIDDPVDVREGKVKLDALDKENLRRLYDGEVAYTDREVGRLFDHLKTRGDLESSIVAVTSDHGEEFWDHGGFEHGHTQFEELLHVPLLLRFPGGQYQGMQVRHPVRLMDLMPTLNAHLGIESPSTFHGVSFLGTLTGEGKGFDGPFYFEGCLYGSEKKALRFGNLKLVYDTVEKKAALYDLESDRLEENNLADAMPKAVEHLMAALRKIQNGFTGPATPVPDLSDETWQKLKALGYVK